MPGRLSEKEIYYYWNRWKIANDQIIKIGNDYVYLPKNYLNANASLVFWYNNTAYCNGRVWNTKKKKWQLSIKAFWYYIFRRRK